MKWINLDLLAGYSQIPGNEKRVHGCSPSALRPWRSLENRRKRNTTVASGFSQARRRRPSSQARKIRGTRFLKAAKLENLRRA